MFWFLLVGISLLATLPTNPAYAQKKKKAARHEAMDYGPFLTATITAPQPAKNTANKGMAVKLGSEAAICFDLDLLRYSAAWTGEFLNLRGTPFDGSHGGHPTVKGKQAWGTAAIPGWAKPGTSDFGDPRSEPYGPLAHEHARFKGLYLAEDKVVFHYTVGGIKVLDHPALVGKDGLTAFARTLQIGATEKSLTHLVASVDKAKGRTEGKLAVLESGSERVAAGLNAAPEGVALSVADGQILLTVPASKTDATFTLVVARIAKDQVNAFTEQVAATKPVELAPLLKGGAERWKETITLKGQRATDDAAYVVDTIPVPEDNPYQSWLRFGGLDFFSDGRAALSTWSGDVWIASGIDDTLEKVTWKRFATGLFQPLGLKIVGNKVHILGREGIVKLHDLNGNGEADYYEAFNNDVATTPGFHEFAFDLHTDPEGNFYYAKGGPVRGGGRGFEYIARHSGCILKVSPDGNKHEVYATGFRAPNGIGVGPKGEVTSGDNEGTWMPQCRLSLVKPGSFNGCVDTAHRKEAPTWYDVPICWMPKNVDNSSGGQVWVTSDKWGPLQGQLLHMSYGTSSLYHVLWEGEGTTLQGGLVKMPLRLMTGVCRARFHPTDGQLYITGLRGWQTNAARDAAFQRVRYTGKPYEGPIGLKVIKDGVQLSFTAPVDKKLAADAENFAAQQWNYLWCSEYGSRDYKIADDFNDRVKEYNRLRAAPKRDGAAIQKLFKSFEPGRTQTDIKAASVSEDGKTITLSIPGLKPSMQMLLKTRLKSATGAPLNLEVYNTINHVPEK
jgi:hypothetical protein